MGIDLVKNLEAQVSANDLDQSSFLLAVSGGPDSMALLKTFLESDFPFEVAHIHYNLRAESLEEANFVKEFCAANDIVCHIKSCTKEDIHPSISNLQEVARNIRYDYFNEILKERKLDIIVLAHHASDNIETGLLNFFRGGHFSSFKGMKSLDGNRFRPFLELQKDDLINHLNNNNVPFFNDSSNFENKYARNLIRNVILPELNHQFPNFQSRFHTNREYLEDITQDIQLISQRLKSQFETSPTQVRIAKNIFIDFPVINPWNEALREYGFSYEQVKLVVKNISEMEVGKLIYSVTHIAEIRDKDLIIYKNSSSNTENLIIDRTGTFNYLSYEIIVTKCDIPKQFGTSPNTEYFTKTLEFPITVRTWKNGDSFKPLGMKGKQLLSDFFINKKMSLKDKNNTPVFESEGQIFWVGGHRISEDKKIKKAENQCYKIFISKKNTSN